MTSTARNGLRVWFVRMRSRLQLPRRGALSSSATAAAQLRADALHKNGKALYNQYGPNPIMGMTPV